MRSRYTTALFLAFVLGLATPRAADFLLAADPDVGPTAPLTSTETTTERERIGRELLHTDRLIAVLRPKVLRSGSAKAQEQFAESIKREREAREAYDQNLFARAARLTREARALAREAAVMVGPPEEDPVHVSRAIEYAQDALGLAEDAMTTVQDPNVRRRYADLKDQLEEARHIYKTGAMKRAYRQAVAVRDGVLDLLAECNEIPVSSDTATKALKRAEQAVERVGRELGTKPIAPAQRWQREALAQLGKARSAFARKEFRDVVIHSKLVERNLDEAVAAQRRGPKGSVRSDA